MDESEDHRFHGVPKGSGENLSHETVSTEKGKPPTWSDIPRFGLIKFYLYLNLIIGIFLTLGYLMNSIGGGIRTSNQTEVTSLTLWSLSYLVFIIMFLGLRKRKRYGLLLLYLITGIQFIVGVSRVLGGERESAFRIITGGLTALIALALLAYFHKRRRYFVR